MDQKDLYFQRALIPMQPIITRRGDYGVRAILHLAKQPPGKVSTIGEIARAMAIPRVFLAKVMKQFVRKGFVFSKRGIAGGYMLARPAAAITLREVIEAVEGPIFLNNCLVRHDPCNRKADCAVAPVWEAIQKSLMLEIDHYRIGDLVGK